MESVQLPTYSQYKHQVDTLIDSGTLTVEQGIILTSVFRNHVEGHWTNVNYLIAATGLNWKKIHYLINGLVLKGAIRKIEKNWYTL
jgi:sRNA-binding regulator protein Hfq